MVKYDWLRDDPITNVKMDEYIDFAKKLGATYIQFKPGETHFYESINGELKLIERKEVEAKSLLLWLDRRIRWVQEDAMKIYVNKFKDMWIEEFGTPDNIPDDYKNKINELGFEIKE